MLWLLAFLLTVNIFGPAVAVLSFTALAVVVHVVEGE